MSDERTDPLEFTAEERAAADTSLPDPDQWEGNAGTPEEEGGTRATASKTKSEPKHSSKD